MKQLSIFDDVAASGNSDACSGPPRHLPGAREIVRVTAPHFCAGLILREGRCVEAAPILKWARGKEGAAIEAYCRRKGWTVERCNRAGPCPNHDGAHVCNECPEHFDTDGWGFVHPSLRKGRVALQRCQGCGGLVTREQWALAAWRCVSCAEAAKAATEAPSPVRARVIAQNAPDGHHAWPPPGAIEWVTLTVEERARMRALLGEGASKRRRKSKG